MINWPSSLVKDLARRKCILFLGAGISMNSTTEEGRRPKGWTELLSEGEKLVEDRKIKKEIRQQIKNGDLLSACELIKKGLNSDQYKDFLRNEFLTPVYKPADIHTDIFKLDARIIITPNFDNIYERHVNTIAAATVIVKKYNEEDIIDSIRMSQRLIIKNHGCITSPDNIIFSRKDYSSARINYRDFYSIIDALAITHTFVFVGAGINDPDIRLIFEDFNYRYRNSRSHYMITPEDKSKKNFMDITSETMNITMLKYNPKNHHEELANSIKELVAKVEEERGNLAKSQDW